MSQQPFQEAPMTTSTMLRSLAAMAAVVCMSPLAAEDAEQTGSPQTAAQAHPEFTIKTTKLTRNFYTLEAEGSGFGGATVGALVGPDGVFLVDSQEGATTDKIAKALAQISNGRVRFLANTHVHLDHVGGNEYFAKTGATILAHDSLRTRQARPNLSASPVPAWRPAAPVAALAAVTYGDRVTVHMNGDEIHLIPTPSAHTDGDTMVRFAVADVVMTGDFFRRSGFPNIDRNNGGTLTGTIAALDAAIEASGPNTKIVPGHGAVGDRAALIATRDMMLGVRDRVAQLLHQGKSADEAVAAKPTSDYDKFVPDGTPATADRFVRQMYAELIAGRTR
jgi:glyoxylase-like metal-dependent hydrolase (beta-lactamase superfamily II)